MQDGGGQVQGAGCRRGKARPECRVQAGEGQGRMIAVVGHGSQHIVEVAAKTRASRGLLSVVAIEARSWCKHVPLVARTDVPLVVRTGRRSACGRLLCFRLRLTSRRYPSPPSLLCVSLAPRGQPLLAQKAVKPEFSRSTPVACGCQSLPLDVYKGGSLRSSARMAF